jgi:hypothetical protein
MLGELSMKITEEHDPKQTGLDNRTDCTLAINPT